MEYENRQTSGDGYRISTPVFPDKSRMNDFYEYAHRIIEQNYKDARTKNRSGMYLADYRIIEKDVYTVVELRLRIRLCGVITESKNVSHIWENDVIAPKRVQKHLKMM